MDEEISIIDGNTRNEKIKNFFSKNKKILISLLFIFILSLIVYFAFGYYKEEKKIEISDLYNSTTIEFSTNNKEKTTKKLIEIINKNDSTYSPLSLYFIIDNQLITDQQKVNELFDVTIQNSSLEKEIKNLIIYKKALYNADNINENDLLEILNPIINSESVWKANALYLMAEYFYFKNQKEKSKEFYNKILILDNATNDLKNEAQKRLNRDLSE